jgi:hypothetical protein
MNAKILSRIFVVFVLGVALGFWWQQKAQGYHLEGREAFIAEQGQRWDRYYSHPHHLAIAIVVSLIVVAPLVGAYELLVAGLFRLFRKSSADEGAS